MSFIKKNKKIVVISICSTLSLIYLIRKFKKKNCKNNCNDIYIQNTLSESEKKNLISIGKYENLNYNDESKDLKFFFKDKKHFKKTLKKMRKEGVKNLQIVSDFDYTISSFFQKDKKSDSLALFRCLMNIRKDPIFIENLIKIRNFYVPIENDSKIPAKEKKEKMKEWYLELDELVNKQNFNKNEF